MTDHSHDSIRPNSIAIIGVAGRFPGARNVEQFWSNVASGVESIASFTDEELLQSGASREWLDRPDFVKAAPVLDDFDKFDAKFFKISRREAEIMDPQQRIMLELAWETMERAGYAGDSYRGLVGVFAGAGGLMSSYLLSPMHVHARLIGTTGSMQCVGNDKDYLSTRISYKLNLRGPSLTVQSACSTSLVAVHLACQSLLAGDCDMALAGGVTVRVPHRMGYIHSGQALLSPDGHCRPFDADAKGTVFGSGAGLVLLKPLARAIDDGDHVHAVIRGSAVNNDGAAKLSYWATNAEGQAAACAEAMAVAEVEPRSIGYMEAHGTATAMGDPVEIFGLNKAFRRGTRDKQFCAIGSVKSNFGHLEAAAGIASLIKAALAVEHKKLPPSINYRRSNPAINFPESPFFVNTECRDWQSDGRPRRAAVNSLGIGGTNAQVILEEAPTAAHCGAGVSPAGVALASRQCWPEHGQDARATLHEHGQDARATRSAHALTLSAKTPTALQELARRYVEYLEANPEANLGDVCFTANTGRGFFQHRLSVVARSIDETRQRLAAWCQDKTTLTCDHGTAEPAGPQVVFLFTGEGSQYVGMGRELYETQPVFRESIEQCDAILGKLMDQPPFSLLYGPAEDESLEKVVYSQPALFALEYALARLWQSWGVEPSALVGQGLGEYVAASLASVFSLKDALELVVVRGRLIEKLPEEGRMMAVLADPARVAEMLRPYADDAWLAAVNGPRQAVVSGRAETVASLAARLSGEGIRTRPLPGNRALYCPLMAPIADDFRRVCEKVEFHKPRIRLISGLSGRPAGEEIASAEYWLRHLCLPIRFSACIMALDQLKYRVFVEIGPQPKLSGLGRRSMREWAGLWTASLKRGQSDWQVLLSSAARLFSRGVNIDWAGVDRGIPRRRIVLPTYPFQRRRYWVEEMALIKQGQKGEVRLLAIDATRLVDTTAIDQCYREIAAALDQSEESNVLLDFGRVEFMSSMALGMLVRVNKRCKEYKVSLKLCGIAPEIRQVFKITGMDKIFEIHADAASAIAALKGTGGTFFRKKKRASYEVT